MLWWRQGWRKLCYCSNLWEERIADFVLQIETFCPKDRSALWVFFLKEHDGDETAFKNICKMSCTFFVQGTDKRNPNWLKRIFSATKANLWALYRWTSSFLSRPEEGERKRERHEESDTVHGKSRQSVKPVTEQTLGSKPQEMKEMNCPHRILGFHSWVCLMLDEVTGDMNGPRLVFVK